MREDLKKLMSKLEPAKDEVKEIVDAVEQKPIEEKKVVKPSEEEEDEDEDDEDDEEDEEDEDEVQTTKEIEEKVADTIDNQKVVDAEVNLLQNPAIFRRELLYAIKELVEVQKVSTKALIGLNEVFEKKDDSKK